MIIFLLEALAVASLVGAEAFLAGFLVLWVICNTIGLGDIATPAASVAGGLALISAVWAICRAIRDRATEPKTD